MDIKFYPLTFFITVVSQDTFQSLAFAVLLTICLFTILGVFNKKSKNENKDENNSLSGTSYQKHYEMIFQRANDIIFFWDVNGQIIEANKKALDVYGYSYDEIIKLNIRQLRTPLTAQQLDIQIALAESAEGIVFETTHQRKDGTAFPVEVSMGLLKEGDKKFYHSIVRDISERKISEEKIKQSENHYRSLAANIPETNLYLFDKDLRFIIADGTEMSRLGLKREDFEGKTLYEVLDEETRNLLIPLYKRALNGETIFREFIYGYFTYTIQIKPLHDSHGFIYGGMTITQNITQRKLAEHQLLESQQKFASIISSAMDAIITVDEEQKITLFNSTAEDIFGYNQNDVIGKSLEMLIPPNYRLEHFHHINKFGMTGVTNRTMGSLGKIYGLKSSGEIFPIEASISQVEVGNKKYFTVILRDITKRLKAEEDLKESESRYKFLFESNPLPMWIFAEESLKFLQVNNAAIEYYGYSKEEFLNMTIKDIRPQDEWERLAEYISSNQERPRYAGIWKHRKKDQTEIFVEIYSHQLEYIGQKARLVLANDVTLQKLNEQKIIQMNEELENRVEERTIQLQSVNKELESFSYSVSHDLRSPLRSLDGFSQALFEDYHDILDETGRDYLGRIRNASQRMAHLIDDLLNLSKVSRHELVRSKVDLSKIARHIADELQNDYKEKVYKVHIEEDLKVNADPRLMELVITNLLGNAFKYSAQTPSPEIEFGSLLKESEKVFFVKDNGAGFDMKFAHRLFGAFQRLHTLNEFPGTGIGLATCHRIISKHGGKIWAESAEGSGSTFYFSL
ncbi:MAG: PAS domain S-box protein [Ignavibacteriales bacterium]|nr:MAG: PAS domain S-box protein [Ignavibacteriales bacterium]